MNCSLCGAPLERPGQGHRCVGGPVPPVRPPASWQAWFWAVLVLAVLFTAVAVARLIGPVPAVLRVVAPLGLFLAVVGWSVSTKRVAAAAGGTAAVVRNWAMSCGWFVLLLSYVLPPVSPAVFHAVRVAAAPLMVAGLLIARGRMARWLVEPAPPAPQGPPVVAADPAVAAPAAHAGGPPPAPYAAGPSPALHAAGPPPARPRPATAVPGFVPPPEPQPEDWDASLWDPDIQADIERRRHRRPSP
jgi:hypothetical protein